MSPDLYKGLVSVILPAWENDMSVYMAWIIRATVNILDSRAIVRVDIGF